MTDDTSPVERTCPFCSPLAQRIFFEGEHVIGLWDAFPVRRFEADLGAMLTAERILKHGGVVGMFPEGTRSRTGYMGEFHGGTAVIALHSGATVLPCAMTGTEVLRNPLNLLKRPRFTVSIGEPIYLEAVRRPGHGLLRSRRQKDR